MELLPRVFDGSISKRTYLHILLTTVFARVLPIKCNLVPVALFTALFTFSSRYDLGDILMAPH